MARRNGRKGDYLAQDQYTGITQYASRLKLDYWGSRAVKPLLRNLQEIATPLLDPQPVSFFTGSDYEGGYGDCVGNSAPQFVGYTNVPTNPNNAAFQAMNYDPAIPDMEIGCTFIVHQGWDQETWGLTGNTATAVVYGNGIYVASQDTGTIATSLDGKNWTNRSSGLNEYVLAAAYAANIFTIIGYDNGTIVTSPDGITWTLHGTTLTGMASIAYGNGKFVAVGDSGRVLTSTDGISWTVQANPGPSTLRYVSVGFGGGIFVARVVDQLAITTKIITSPDGITWTNRTDNFTNGALNLYGGVAYGNGIWVALNDDQIVRSTDNGATWALQTSGLSSGAALDGVIFANGHFTATAGLNAAIITSPDGVTWSVQATPVNGTTDYLTSIAANGTGFVAVGFIGGTTAVIWSPNGT